MYLKSQDSSSWLLFLRAGFRRQVQQLDGTAADQWRLGRIEEALKGIL